MRRTIDWADGAIVIIDQTALPTEFRLLELRTVDELVDAVQRLAVRGAPALGAAGALGVALSAHQRRDVHRDAERIAHARPTAVNLAWGVERALAQLENGPEAVLEEARALLDEDERLNKTASHHAAEIVLAECSRRPLRLLTHCNAGRLATVGWGSALGVVWHLHTRGLVEEVLVDETRPLLQGARLTAWELAQENVPYRVQPDSAAAAAMARGLVDCVLVGADRIAANGDVANKIGTYGLAIAAKHHGIPFVVVAPSSTVDSQLADGTGITIEERDARELTEHTTQVFNPAFDVTPFDLITAVVTEHGTFRGADRSPGPRRSP
ncbi:MULTISPECIES: S-methyl-5-thioribose-1-phosphate isomerase [unclassified Amycolatopsis]|uniref:S-methyl-5-thioribose-1-phosphate isomerase n=1 Tax=unclassified Amycolatopsis TaxID=2618356 RepID=UPI0028760AB1|nr:MULTISPECIES: S-methyl-5-thioribose-1-phosphate isomerase [unclassified Amycolatopsis]MDS0135429.1 S-methyl-5-thioribose-1-phosphate isomerase [Amycolatopsis sp. 505]MDS0140880.1 S-methyl-5-thioribose-1-phosphate isomerase [Amycolatopsis sp. CM201R]